MEFAPAVMTNTAVVLALAGASGSGKTKSALELAVGLAGDRGQILMIDSEGRRGLHYADEYRFFHHDWRPPYSPEALGELLREANRREFTVIIVDSASDEHEGEGGLLEMWNAEMKEQERKGWQVHSAAAWATPTAKHKHHVVRWLRHDARCHVIFCLRATERLKFDVVVDHGKKRTVVTPLGWTPVYKAGLLYEFTTSLLFTPDSPGFPRPLKIYDKHIPFFPPDRQVSRTAGKQLSEWAAGGATTPPLPAAPSPAPTPLPLGEPSELEGEAEKVAASGSEVFRRWWANLNKDQKSSLRPFLARYRGLAEESDASARG